jgi:hypothetical protein
MAVESGACVVTVHYTLTFNNPGIPGLLVLRAEIGQVAQVNYDYPVTAFVIGDPEGVEKDFVAIMDIGGTVCFLSN